MTYKTINPKDPGSLLVGKNEMGIEKGDQIVIKGDPKGPRTVTYVMGSAESSNVHVCCRDTGPFPVSKDAEVEFEVIKKGQPVVQHATDEAKTA